MAEVAITAGDVKRLASKLMGLQHVLTSRERAILWGALGVAAEVLSKSGAEPGRRGVVQVAEGDGNPVIEVDNALIGPDLEPDFPDMLARAFYPETQPGDAEPGGNGGNAGGDPTDGDAGKIGDLVGVWRINSDHRVE